jgi:hypothetical protein
MYRPLIDKCRGTPPDAIELSALAAMLHSFYTGIENIFKRIALDLDGGVDSSRAWHRTLLNSMTERTSERPAVITMQLRHTLLEYLQFRRVFRSAYGFELDWDRMAHLVVNCEAVLTQLENELDAFLRETGPRTE